MGVAVAHGWLMATKADIKWLFVWFFLLTASFSTSAAAPVWVTQDGAGSYQVHLWFFWSQTCPHCLDAKVAVERLDADYPWLVLHSHELTSSPADARRYVDMARQLGREARSVPGFILCGEMMTGFDRFDTTGRLLQQAALDCLHRVRQAGPSAAQAPSNAPGSPAVAGLDLAHLSLPVVTVLLAAMDAFNPCAFFVLLFLLSLLTHEHSRGRMLLVGGVFVLVSGLVYFGLMAAWLNVFLIAGELRIVTLAAGLVAIAMAAANLKDYFWFRQGFSLSIPDTAKPRLFDRMRRLLRVRSLPAMLLGTVTLALAANSYELLCTAGFPFVYTRLLTLQGLSGASHYAYLALYNTIYVLPLLVILLLYVRTLGSRKLSEGEGRVLKLVSGLMMLGLGTALVIAPQALSRPELAAGLVLIAVLAGVLAWRRNKRPSVLSRK
jgi:glutaredoxin